MKFAVTPLVLTPFDPFRGISLKNTKLEAGEGFLPLGCMAKARAKGYCFSQTPVFVFAFPAGGGLCCTARLALPTHPRTPLPLLVGLLIEGTSQVDSYGHMFVCVPRRGGPGCTARLAAQVGPYHGRALWSRGARDITTMIVCFIIREICENR